MGTTLSIAVTFLRHNTIFRENRLLNCNCIEKYVYFVYITLICQCHIQSNLEGKMDQRFEKVSNEFRPLATRELRWWTWKRVLVVSLVIIVILEIGTYAFNWTWTGFKDNDTVWDYMQLLLLPIALAIVPIWFMAEEAQRRVWLSQLKLVIVVPVVLLVILFIGTYAFNWTWTGFKDHGRVWDWLSLLLVPVIVAVLPIWYSTRQGSSSNGTGEQQPAQQFSPAPANQQDWPPPPPVQPPQRVRQAPQE